MLNIKNLKFSYDDKPFLRDLTFSLREGEVTALIGTSGAGKTTLFKLLTGLLPLQGGEIAFDCLDGLLPFSYMTQEDLLLPWRSVLSNLTLTTELGPHPTLDKETALKLLSEMGLEGTSHFFPDELSGGMRQRVSLARALMPHRPLLLLDEPFASLDVCTREQIYALLSQYQKEHETTILLITHDFRDALSLADRIMLLSEGTLTHEWSIHQDLRHSPHYVGQMLEEIRLAIQTK